MSLAPVPGAVAAGVVALLLHASPAAAAELKVASDEELRAAVARLRAGDTLLVAPGEYRGGLSLRGLEGTAKAPTVIAGSDPNNPPVFVGGGTAWQFSDCIHLTVRSIAVRGCTGNGINVDDAGTFDTPLHHVTIEDVTITDTGPRGNHDALKMSGIAQFVVRRCRFEGWGGSAIDMVGCRDGVVEDCRFQGKEGFSGDSGVQMKGGTSDVLVQTSFFDGAGQRAINLGGSTGLEYFRPKPGQFEAERITVAGNRFVGGVTPVAFVSSDGGRFVRNTVVHPEKWVARILQEQRAPGFLACRNGVFEENLVVFDGRVGTFVNVGPDTAPETFVFRHNAWFRADGASRPTLPTPESDGVVGVDPKLEAVGTPEMRATSRDARLSGIGADAYVRPAR